MNNKQKFDPMTGERINTNDRFNENIQQLQYQKYNKPSKGFSIFKGLLLTILLVLCIALVGAIIYILLPLLKGIIFWNHIFG